MTAELHQRVRDLFDSAVVLPTSERQAFLAKACGGDSAVLDGVNRLLEAHDQAPFFLDDGTRRSPRLGRYILTGELGHGAMGVVYKAVDPLIGRSVAIKTLRLSTVADPKEVELLRDGLLREAHSAGVLFHPGIVIIFDVGQEGDTTFVAMERVDGSTLQNVMESGQKIEPARILDILRQTAAALDYAHTQGIVHRDVKPANIMLHQGTVAKITDFGIAKIAHAQHHTLTGMVMGTPIYMSPEQIESRPVDGRSDQFALAVVAYELFSGTRPFAGDSFTSLAHNIVYGARPSARLLNPTLPPAIDEVLGRALARLPDQRYPTCLAFVDALAGAFQTAAPIAVPPEPASKSKAKAWMAVAAVVVLAAGGGIGYRAFKPAPAPTPVVPQPVTAPVAAAPVPEPAPPKTTPKKAIPSPPPDPAKLYQDAMSRRAAGQLPEAAALFRKSADLGDHRAMVLLGSMYAQGAGLPRDDAQAVAWYRKAAETGDNVAMDALGQMYASGRAVPKDPVQAADWFRRAANLGNASAKAHLAQLTTPTVSVPANRPWTDTAIDLNPGDIITINANGPAGTLVGRVGPTGTVYEIGTHRAFQVRTGGRFYLGLKDAQPNDNWTATLTVKPAH